MFVLYGATGVVLLGCLRLVWSKRKLFHGRPAGPISLPFTPSATDFLNGYITPSSSRPTSPLPYSRDIRRRSSSSPTPHAPNLLWVPMYMDAEDRHKAPTLTFDPSSARWARSTPEHQADCDNASLHSLHTIKASARNRWSQAKKSTPSRPETSALTSDESTSEDDVESQRFLPSKRRRPRGPLESSSGLPPSYGGLFSNWAASIFRPSSSQASPDVKSPTTPNDRQCTSALMPPSSRPLSRGSSFSSEPPAYPEDLESSMDVSTVDRLLSEMDPQSRER